MPTEKKKTFKTELGSVGNYYKGNPHITTEIAKRIAHTSAMFCTPFPDYDSFSS